MTLPRSETSSFGPQVPKKIKVIAIISIFYRSRSHHRCPEPYLNTLKQISIAEKIMSPRSAKRRAAKSRRGKRPVSKVSVMPVAVTSNAASGEAVIPVSVKSGADSAQAVIPVQVSGRGKGVRKRAAVIPVAVQKRRARKPKARAARPRPRPAQVEAAHREFPRPWRTFVADQLDGFVKIERDVVQVAKDYSQTAVAFVRWLVLPPASGRAPQRATILAWRSPQTQPARRRAA